MAELVPAELLRPPRRFLRSANLERDFDSSDGLEGYVVTPPLRSSLRRVLSGLEPGSTQRAWRVTGDYGSGKSSFGLALARLVDPDPGPLPAGLSRLRSGLHANLLPILVTGAREQMARAVIRALERALDRVSSTPGRPPKPLETARAVLERGPSGTDGAEALHQTAIDLLSDAADYMARSHRGTGVLLVLDEMGKFLEHAALNPAGHDVYFLQQLGEAAARSGDHQICVVGLLHQGIYAYAEQLSPTAKKEWEKISGRYEELLFNHPIEHTTALVAGALNVRTDRLPRALSGEARQAMERAIDLRWYGPAPAREVLLKLAPQIYPLHPSVVPVLARLLGRFGQSERSVFSFLFSHEPGGLQEFAARQVETGSTDGSAFFRLPELFDYVRTTLGHRLSTESYRSHWLEISATVDAVRAEEAEELEVVKTVGVLNLLNAHDLLATRDALRVALRPADPAAAQAIDGAISALRNGRQVLYDRGTAGGFALWPHTSVNLERALERAETASGPVGAVAPLLARQLDTRPLVARRHYIETGNLRYFEVRYAPVQHLREVVEKATTADGRIMVALPESGEEHDEAVRFATAPEHADRGSLLVVVPQPLSALSGAVGAVRRWEWIAANTPELNHDRYAAEEVARQLESSRAILSERLRDWLGMHHSARDSEAQWFRRGERMRPVHGRELFQHLSDICDETFPLAPRVQNELVNRASISSAASGARMRLIERLLEHSSEPLLGLPERKAPPEKSMYLSVLRDGRVHMPSADACAIVIPEAGDEHDPRRLNPVLTRIGELIDGAPDGRLGVPELFKELQAPPYGVRQGLLPLLLAIFVKAHEPDIAIYEKGTFVRHIDGALFMRLIKMPELFAVQLYRVAGVRGELFGRLLVILGQKAPADREARLLDVVTPLLTFAARLSDYTFGTRSLSPIAAGVRQALVEGREPAVLLFRRLPEACGLKPFTANEAPDSAHVQQFVDALRAALEELRAAYAELLGRVRRQLLAAFDLDADAPASRAALATQATAILGAVKEPTLRGLCGRLADSGLSEDEWLEALASFVRERPPTRWTDEDVIGFSDDIQLLAKRFRHVEAVAFGGDGEAAAGAAVRISITHPDGIELERVVHTQPHQEQEVTEVEAQIGALLDGLPQATGLAAASRAIWRVLAGGDDQHP